MKGYLSAEQLQTMSIEKYLHGIMIVLPSFIYSTINEEEDYLIYSADIFIHGLCHLFAAVLKYIEPDYEVYSLKGDTCGCHYFCKCNGEYIDVKGITTDFKELTDGLCGSYSIDNSKSYSFVDEDFKYPYYEVALAFAWAIIVEEPKRYYRKPTIIDNYSREKKKDFFQSMLDEIKRDYLTEWGMSALSEE